MDMGNFQDKMDSAGAIEIVPGEKVTMSREEAIKRLDADTKKATAKKGLDKAFKKVQDGQ